MYELYIYINVLRDGKKNKRERIRVIRHCIEINTYENKLMQ